MKNVLTKKGVFVVSLIASLPVAVVWLLGAYEYKTFFLALLVFPVTLFLSAVFFFSPIRYLPRG